MSRAATTTDVFNAIAEPRRREILANPESPAAILSLYTSPGYIITVVASLVLYALVVIFANRDVAELKKREIANPFHWAFAFLGPVVYTIGRSVIVRRRTGHGLGPLWGMIAVFVIAIIVSTVWSLLLTQQILQMIPVTP